MFLRQLTIRNYKSLRDVTFAPTPLTAIVGPNAAGKSNFASAVSFLSDVYRYGLEQAVSRKDGYENIAFRKQKRSKAPIEFEVITDLSLHEAQGAFFAIGRPLFSQKFRISHSFSFAAKGTGFRAAFKVGGESLRVSTDYGHPATKPGFSELLSINRLANGEYKLRVNQKWEFAERAKSQLNSLQTTNILYGRSKDQFLLLPTLRMGNAPLPYGAGVFQFSAEQLRNPGISTPDPSLSISGDSLPALVDWLQQNHEKEWGIVLSGMREIMPGLNNISVEYLHNKRLGLFFEEEGVGRSWDVGEVSGGTIQALALLVAAVDPRTSLLVIDEVESSVHPWVLRAIMRQMREVSKLKNVIVTSHSPVLVNLLKPEEIWIAYRKRGATHLKGLMDLDPSVKEGWEEGHFRLSEFLDSGVVDQAVPGGAW